MSILWGMRTPAGTVAYRAGLVIAGLFSAAAAAGLAVLILRPEARAALQDLPRNPWWFFYRESSGPAPWAAAARLAAAAAAGLLGIVAAVRANGLFRKGGSPLLPFVTLFLLSLSLEGLRAGTALLAADDGSIAASIVLTRVIYWGRFVGLLALLIAGLYCIDLKYRKYGILAGVVFLVSFAMAAYIPLDRTVFLAQLTWKLGDEQGVWFVTLMVALLVLATSAGAAATRRDRRFLLIALAMTLFIAARELLFFAVSPWALAAGLAGLAAGAVTCQKTLAAVYRKAGE
jgi:hypothetical protein